MFLTDNIMIFFAFAFLNEYGILSAITCPWVFLITVSLSANDEVLPDIAMKTNKN